MVSNPEKSSFTKEGNISLKGPNSSPTHLNCLVEYQFSLQSEFHIALLKVKDHQRKQHLFLLCWLKSQLSKPSVPLVWFLWMCWLCWVICDMSTWPVSAVFSASSLKEFFFLSITAEQACFHTWSKVCWAQLVQKEVLPVCVSAYTLP